MTQVAIIVLGCRILEGGRPGPAAERRVQAAARAFEQGLAPLVVVAGGRLWHGISEARALRRALVELGVPDSAVVEESWSLSTVENARYSAYLLDAIGIPRAIVVTCDWHMPRALRCFRAVGMTVQGRAAPSPPVSNAARRLRDASERFSAALIRFALLFAVALAVSAGGCRPRNDAAAVRAAPASSAAKNARAANARVQQLAIAELRRDVAAITADDLTSRDVAVRRRASRALARIAEPRATELLAPALTDEDPEVVEWAAYGLGFNCKGHEPTTVRRIAARAARLAADETSFDGTKLADALAGALARCAGPEAEHTLRAWLSTGERAESAAIALGRIAADRRRLEDSSLVALLDAAARRQNPVKNALFAFTRLGALGPGSSARLLDVARAALAAGSPERAFAVRALGKVGPRAVPELARVLTSPEFRANERSDAARALGELGPEGQSALLEALPKLQPAALEALTSSEFGPLLTALDALRPHVNGRREILESLASLPIDAASGAVQGRRVILLRCSAARVLAGSRTLFPALTACDPKPDGRALLLAVVAVLDRAPITGARAERWKGLANGSDPVVREAALALMPAHPEIPGASDALAKALGASEQGVVAAAARVIAAHPERASDDARAFRETRDTDSGTASPLGLRPSAAVVAALERASKAPRQPDSIEVRAALIDAVAALQLLSFKARLETDCTDANPTVREHATRALGLLGDPYRKCDRHPPAAGPLELGVAVLPPSFELRFTTDAGELQLNLDTADAPFAAARIASLARAGFYDGIAIHRAMPGFVVQFGDPGGDGFGGAGKQPLPCETGPGRFDALRVGVALAGRDTGSSQIFVTLGPLPHLDGDFALIGRASAGWERVAAGDVIRKVVVSP